MRIIAGEFEMPLRITLAGPPHGVLFCLQAGMGELIGQQRSTGEDLIFDFVIRVAEAGTGGMPRFLGHFVQGPPSARFVYICSGTYAGESDSSWSRRAKIPLYGITAELVEQMRKTPSSRLEVRINGKARDGGPACATVPLLDGWRVAQ